MSLSKKLYVIARLSFDLILLDNSFKIVLSAKNPRKLPYSPKVPWKPLQSQKSSVFKEFPPDLQDVNFSWELPVASGSADPYFLVYNNTCVCRQVGSREVEEEGRNGGARPSELTLVVGGGLAPPSLSPSPRNKSPVTVQEWVDSLPLTPTEPARYHHFTVPNVQQSRLKTWKPKSIFFCVETVLF